LRSGRAKSKSSSLELEKTNRLPDVHGSRAQRQVKIRRSALVVVQVHVTKPRPIRREQLLHGASNNPQVGVADVEMQAQLGQRIEQLSHLAGRVEVSGQVLQHHPHTSAPGIG